MKKKATPLTAPAGDSDSIGNDEFEKFTGQSNESIIESLAWAHQQLASARDDQEFINNALAKLDDFKDEREHMNAQRLLEEMKERKAREIERLMEQIKRLEDVQRFKLNVCESVAMNEQSYNNK
jgi:hypothetical protein